MPQAEYDVSPVVSSAVTASLVPAARIAWCAALIPAASAPMTSRRVALTGSRQSRPWLGAYLAPDGDVVRAGITVGPVPLAAAIGLSVWRSVWCAVRARWRVVEPTQALHPKRTRPPHGRRCRCRPLRRP